MYPKVKTVRRGGRNYEYLELVEGRREGTRVRQHVVANLGRLDELVAGGQLEALAAGLSRLHQPPAGTRRHVGPLLIVAHYLQALDVAGIVDAVIPRRGRALAGHGEIAAVLAASRLCSPAPLYDIAGWASSAAVAELLGVPAALLNDDRLGRSHLDLTAVRFAGHYAGSGLAEKGWSADRTIARQVKTLQATVPSGVALYFRPHKGAAGDLTAFMAAIEALAAALPPGLVVVADSGLGYLENLCAADAAHVKFVVPLRADTGWAGRFDAGVPGGLADLQVLDHVSWRERNLPASQRTVWKGLLALFPVTGEDGTRHDLQAAYIWSSEEAASVRDARERALAKAEEALTRIRNGLGGRSCKTRRQVDAKVAQILAGAAAGLLTARTGTRAGKPVITWARDDDAIAAASRLDGLYALATNLPGHGDGTPLTALDVLKIYKGQWIVEQRHRDLKQTLKVRPVFLHNDDRIQALIAIIGIALLIFGLIEAELRASLGDGVALPGILPEGRPAIPTARAVLAGRLRRPPPHLHPRRHRPGPPHPGAADHPRPTRHPATLARKTSLNRANHDRYLCGKRA